MGAKRGKRLGRHRGVVRDGECAERKENNGAHESVEACLTDRFGVGVTDPVSHGDVLIYAGLAQKITTFLSCQVSVFVLFVLDVLKWTHSHMNLSFYVSP